MNKINQREHQHDTTRAEEIRQHSNAEEARFRFKMGLRSITKSATNALISIAFVIASIIMWLRREHIPLPDDKIPAAVCGLLLQYGIPIVALCLLCLLIFAFGTPFGAKSIQSKLYRVGLRNSAGEAPIVGRRSKQKFHGKPITVYEFDPVGIPLSDWLEKQGSIERIFNHIWIKHPKEDGALTVLYVATARDILRGKGFDKDF